MSEYNTFVIIPALTTVCHWGPCRVPRHTVSPFSPKPFLRQDTRALRQGLGELGRHIQQLDTELGRQEANPSSYRV
jgi:hypothetical protein